MAFPFTGFYKQTGLHDRQFLWQFPSASYFLQGRIVWSPINTLVSRSLTNIIRTEWRHWVMKTLLYADNPG